MKFILASSNRYPTEKAYGVSFENTGRALRSLGYSVEIYSPSFQGLDRSGTTVVQVAHRTYRKLHSNGVILRSLVAFKFYFVEIVFSIATLLRVKRVNGPVTIWTRSTILCAAASKLLRGTNFLFVLEIHDTKPRVNSLLGHIKNDFRTTVITPLEFQARFLQERFKLPQVYSVGNAAPSEYFADKSRGSSNVIIGYVGKIESSGHSNNIAAILNLSKIIYRGDLNIQIELVGISSNEISEYIGESAFNLLPPNITFIEHISHSQIQNHLSRFSIGLVPYPESDYHNQRFPIKVVEYAAMGIPIIICNPNYLDSVIPRDYVYFSDPTGESIYDSVLEIVNNPDKAAQKVEQAIKWSKELTYIKRTKKILRLIGTVTDESL